MQVKEGKIFDDVSSGVSQLASKVGCPSTRGHYWSWSPHSGTGTGAIGPCTCAQVTYAAGALAAAACKPAPCRLEECGDSFMGGTGANLLLLFYPFAALTIPW